MLRFLLLSVLLPLSLVMPAQAADYSAANRPKLKLESMCKDAPRSGQCFGCHRVVSNPKVWPQVAGAWQQQDITRLISRQGG